MIRGVESSQRARNSCAHTQMMPLPFWEKRRERKDFVGVWLFQVVRGPPPHDRGLPAVKAGCGVTQKMKESRKPKIPRVQVFILRVQAQRFPQHYQPRLRSLENTDARKVSFPSETSLNDFRHNTIISPGALIKARISKATQTQRIWKLKTPTKMD